MQQIKTRPNGTKSLLLQSPGATSASVQIWFRAGSALEENSNRGIAHFLEHMFFKGTKTRPGSVIAREVESFGGEINAFTSFDYTCYYINCPNEKSKESLNILLDMVSNPLFSEEELIPERGVVYEEFRRSQDSPQQFGFQKLQKQCFKPPYNNAILGTPKTIQNFTRKQLTDFRNKFYNTTNALLIVAGDFKEDSIYKIVDKYKLPKGKETVRPTFKVSKKHTIQHHFKDVGMTTINFSFPAHSIDHKMSAAEDIAISAFSYGESSPLYYGLVSSKSLANSCAGSTMYFNGGGFHNLRVTTPPKNVSQLFKELYRLLKLQIEKGFDRDDIEKIKNQFIASKIYEQESLEYRAFSLGSSYAGHGTIAKESDYIERIKSVSLNDVNKALQNIFSRVGHIAMQLPENAKETNILKAAQNFQDKLVSLKKENQNTITFSSSKFDSQVKLLNLKPGVQLLYRHNPLTPTFVMHAYLKGGLSYETTQNNGIFGLLSNLLTKGNKETSLLELKRELENMSASFNNFTGKNAYGLTMHGLSKDFELLAKHFYNSLLYPNFDQENFDHEREMSLRALISRESDPTSKCFETVSSIMFPSHHYRFNTLGTMESLARISTNAIKKTHQKQIKKSPLLFTYCGDAPLESVLEILNKHLGSLPPRESTPTSIQTPKKQYGRQEHLEFDREQTQIFMGIPTEKLDDKQNITLKLLTTYLSGQSSELFVDVRDRKGLCYSVQPVHFKALEAGYWGIYMASGHDKVEQAKEAIQSLLHKLGSKGISLSEFKRIKKMIKGQEQINIQTNDDYANIYSIPVLHSMGVDWHHKMLQHIEKITHQEFKETLRELLKNKLNIVTAGRS